MELDVLAESNVPAVQANPPKTATHVDAARARIERMLARCEIALDDCFSHNPEEIYLESRLKAYEIGQGLMKTSVMLMGALEKKRSHTVHRIIVEKRPAPEAPSSEEDTASMALEVSSQPVALLDGPGQHAASLPIPGAQGDAPDATEQEEGLTAQWKPLVRKRTADIDAKSLEELQNIFSELQKRKTISCASLTPGTQDIE